MHTLHSHSLHVVQIVINTLKSNRDCHLFRFGKSTIFTTILWQEILVGLYFDGLMILLYLAKFTLAVG